MKAMRYLTIAAALAATACLPGQTITEFMVGKLFDTTQSDGSGSVAGANPYGFFAQVKGTGLTGTYSVTNTTLGTQGLTISGNEAFFEDAFAYSTAGALDTVYGTGDYVFSINTGTQESATLSLGSDAYPSQFSITSVTGGTWSGGKLVVDPSLGFTLNFDSFSGMVNGTDKIILGIDAGFDAESTTNTTTSFTIGAGQISLAPGATTSAEIAFAKVVDLDNSLGFTGVGAYVTIVSFQIQAIPEPSTYAVIAGVVALGGAMVHRRRRRTGLA